MNFALRLIQGQIGLFKFLDDAIEFVEILKDHRAMQREIDSWLSIFVANYAQVTELDEAYRADVYQEHVPYSELVAKCEEGVRSAYLELALYGEKLNASLVRLDGHNLVKGMKHLGAFRAALEELRGIAGEDNQAVSEGLARLEREALQEHQASRTLELRSMDG